MNEKKVEYIELIYDLIFVYLVGRSNALLHNINGGFFGFNTYMTYILSTLVILQVWFFSTLFINRYGENGIFDHIGIFINMYLLYYLADGTRTDWNADYYTVYNAAWGLILINLAGQYYIRLRKGSGMTPWEDSHIKYHIILLLIQAGVVFAAIPIYALFRVPLSWLSLIVGFAASVFTGHIDAIIPVNFEHLTERVMLYVVFSFGETIVSLSDYFDGGFGLNTMYFSLFAFLIISGLFLSYGVLYNSVIDRERITTGTWYMMLHIFLIIALNNITTGMEFMRMDEVRAGAKNIFLTLSFLAYFLFLFIIAAYSKKSCRANKRFWISAAVFSAVFTVLMFFFYSNGRISIAVSAVYVYAMFSLTIKRKAH